MSSFTANINDYNIATENELSSIIGQFNIDYILSIIDHTIDNIHDQSLVNSSINLVASIEQNFKHILNVYSFEKDVIKEKRDTIYNAIITKICTRYNLNLFLEPDTDIYTVAYYLYDFFVCNFLSHMIRFFRNFIVNEKVNIYEGMNLQEFKKNKDSSTVYGKKVFKDIKLAVINANMSAVLNSIANYNIDFKNILNLVYDNKNIANFIESIITPRSNFFQEYYINLLNTGDRANYITNIRLEIQNSMSTDNIGGITNE